VLPAVLGLTCAGAVRAQETPAVRVWDSTFSLPTYVEEPPDPNPPFDFFQPRRVNYPYTIRDRLTDRREPHEWRALYLENEFLRCIVLPDVGGHLYSCTDKVNGEEMFYANPSLKLTQIGYRGAWAAFGVEFNFPVSHNWMSTSPVDFAITHNADSSASMWVGNVDRVTGMQWRVELRLRPGRAVLEHHTTLYNRSDFRHRFYWWTNAAVEVWDDSRIVYPMEYTASHGFRDIDTWPVDSRGTDNSVVGNHKFGPVSRFSHGSREGYMAVYHPRTGSGVVHYSSPADLPAKKIWSWGSDQNGLNWRNALSDNQSAYVEIQAGLFRNQETYGFLEPQESVRFSEYWIPIGELGGVTRANPDAVVRVWRSPSSLHFVLNVTRPLPNSTLDFRFGEEEFLGPSAPASLLPGNQIQGTLDGVPDDVPYTLTLRDAQGRVVLEHTEGVYDFTAADRIHTGPRDHYPSPPVDQRSEGDWVELGDDQERNGRLLEALATYEEALRRFPLSVALTRAAGRLSVILKRYADGARYLNSALERVSNDYESSYYLGRALSGWGNAPGARRAWERSQAYGTFRPASLLGLAAIAARDGAIDRALELVQEITSASRDAVRPGGIEVALLRTSGRIDSARARLREWIEVDPTSSFLRYEGTLLGTSDPALWHHLAGDPERILEVAVDYLHFGLYQDALVLLGRDYPRGPGVGVGVVSEPGMPYPDQYPLIGYYRAFCREALGQDGSRDRAQASLSPTTYVFPNRHETIAVLAQALEHNPDDATAYFLMGSLDLSGGMALQAMDRWEQARRRAPSTPVLHRNMGYTVLHSGGAPERAAELFSEGRRVDPMNVDLYFGLDQTLERMGRSAGERADSLLTFPEPMAMPAKLVYHLARVLAEAQRFDEAEALFRIRFFPSEEGGVNVREVYLEVLLARTLAMAKEGRCADVRRQLRQLGEPDSRFTFTLEGIDALLARGRPAELRAAVIALCP
jgi:tetratricopeptide (TPR) repeat protein